MSSKRWNAQHGFGRSVREHLGRTKFSYATQSAASDMALLMDLKHGVAFEAYPCRWGSNYRDGEIFAVHWHVGRAWKRGESRGDERETDLEREFVGADRGDRPSTHEGFARSRAREGGAGEVPRVAQGVG